MEKPPVRGDLGEEKRLDGAPQDYPKTPAYATPCGGGPLLDSGSIGITTSGPERKNPVGGHVPQPGLSLS